ncbi:MAG: dolichyl-phosphate-mannose-protein mannosyltransferase [Frankiales bacterium]|jgi:dolichyl-phosphate-mannose--protein O-mannosyl transferase|nr:dolichyl-phosphate-mannose-protein mannosyltransferase [Frankiales bacterium]
MFSPRPYDVPMSATLAAATTSARDDGVLPAVTAETLRDRLVPAFLGSRWAGWAGPIGVTVLGFVLRVWGAGSPHDIMFDEIYYVHDAVTMHSDGVELAPNNGDTSGEYVVHPPLGKWMISLGFYFFHVHMSAYNPASALSKGKIPPYTYTGAFAWRFMSVVFGSLAILLLARTARRMTRSNLLGTIAGLLLALDGLEFVQSRMALLDIFLMFWIVAGFACLVRDRDHAREKLAEAVERGDLPGRRVFSGTGWRPWLLMTGICTGGACATKWDGVWFLPAYALLAVVWEVGARRTAGGDRPWRSTLRQAWWRIPAWMGAVPVALYTATWTGWFLAGNKAYEHDDFVRPGQNTWQHTIAVLHGWIHYHEDAFKFARTLYSPHPWSSRPISWLFMSRPVLYYSTGPKAGQQGCKSGTCVRQVLGTGTPAIWLPGVIALVVVTWWAVARRDWRASAIAVGFATTFLPWLPFAAYIPGTGSRSRTMFFFYELAGLPFVVLAITLCLGFVLGPPGAALRRRMLGAGLVGVYVALVVVNFWFLFPILTGGTLSHSQWAIRMLFPSWI